MRGIGRRGDRQAEHLKALLIAGAIASAADLSGRIAMGLQAPGADIVGFADPATDSAPARRRFARSFDGAGPCRPTPFRPGKSGDSHL